MRARLVSLVLVVAVGAVAAPAVTAATKPTKKTHHKKKGPTLQQQIKAAVAKAERSPDLWATVNQCSSSATVPPGDVVGIRGQMPSLGIAAKMYMQISVSYWNYNDNQFESANASTSVSLGKGAHGAHQGGVNFPFAPPTAGSQPYVVRGTITFEWTIAGKVVGKVTRNTGHGYANVGFSNPPGFSAGTCTLM